VGAPVGIGLVAGIAVPAMIIGLCFEQYKFIPQTPVIFYIVAMLFSACMYYVFLV